MGWFANLGPSIAHGYASFVNLFPPVIQNVIELFLLILLVSVYAVLIWKFYRFIARKNIISLNLKQYNRSEHPFFSKFLGVFLYLVEYVLVLPFLVFLWFAVFTIFLILLTESLEVIQIIKISAVIVGAIRLISYMPRYGQELAKEISKLLPFTLLGLAIVKGGFFDIENIFAKFTALSTVAGDIVLFFLFIMFLEIFLRLFDFILSLMGFKDPDPEDEEE